MDTKADHREIIWAPSWAQRNVALVRDGGSALGSARRVFAALGPVLQALRSEGRLLSFHFMRKPPDMRLRLSARARADAERVERDLDALLDGLVREGAVERWFPSVYEPETARFGGPEAMDAVHAWFDVDTQLWMRLDRLRAGGGAGLAPHAVCAAVAHDLVVRAVDGPAEAWDVWQSYAASLGPVETSGETSGEALSELPDLGALAERASADEASALAEYAAANAELASALRAAWSSGKLGRGMRAIVATAVLFHFHRHGLSPQTHAALAAAMSRLLTPTPA